MHFHTPFHPFQHHGSMPLTDLLNLILILLGAMVALLIGPIHLD